MISYESPHHNHERLDYSRVGETSQNCRACHLQQSRNPTKSFLIFTPLFAPLDRIPVSCRAASVSSLMYVKEDLIIPQQTTFYDLISSKARGKSGPLFHFDVHEDIRMQNDATVEKEESHAGIFQPLEQIKQLI